MAFKIKVKLHKTENRVELIPSPLRIKLDGSSSEDRRIELEAEGDNSGGPEPGSANPIILRWKQHINDVQDIFKKPPLEIKLLPGESAILELRPKINLDKRADGSTAFQHHDDFSKSCSFVTTPARTSDHDHEDVHVEC